MCSLYRPPDAAFFREILRGRSGDWSQTPDPGLFPAMAGPFIRRPADLNDPDSMPAYQALDGTFGMIPH